MVKRLRDGLSVAKDADSAILREEPPALLRMLGYPSVNAVTVKRPSIVSLLLGLVPFVGICFTVPLWDRLYPMILGIPFNLAWLLCWIVISALCLWAAYRVESKRDKGGAAS